MWGMTVEADTGDILVVTKIVEREDGIASYGYGNTILSFFMQFILYCENNDRDPDTIQWFEKLGENVSFNLCEEGKIFCTSIISGNMDYSENEYEIYKQRTGSDTTRENFLKGLEYARKAWKDARNLAFITMELAEGLRKMPQVSKHWFIPQDTADGMETISYTINLLIERHAKQVRINIS